VSIPEKRIGTQCKRAENTGAKETRL
jgi:hypothetical protein